VESLTRQQYELPEIRSLDLENLSVTISAPPPPTAEELLEALHQRVREKASRRERKPGEAIAWGDEVECDFITLCEGRILPGGIRRSARLEMREFLHLPGFIEGIVGMPTFSAKTFELTLPPDYVNSEVAGKRATFYLEARRVYQVEPLPLDDREALNRAGLGESVEEALERIAEQIDEEQGEALLVEATQAVLAELAERIDLPVPDAAVDEELRLTWEHSEGVVLEGKGFSREMVALSLAGFLADPQHRQEAELRIKVGLALGAVASEHGLAPDEECARNLLEAAAGGAEVTPKVARESLKLEHEGPEQLARAALYQKAVEFVVARAHIEVED